MGVSGQTELSLDCDFPREQLEKAVPWGREVTLAPQDLLENKDCLEHLGRKGPRSVRGRQRGAGGRGARMGRCGSEGPESLFKFWLTTLLPFISG